MRNKYAVLFFVCFQTLVLISCTGSMVSKEGAQRVETASGFDEVCLVFSEALDAFEGRSEEASKYIENNISNRVQEGDAREAYEVMFHLEPEKRYALFQQAAQESLQKSWQCKPMEKMLSK